MVPGRADGTERGVRIPRVEPFDRGHARARRQQRGVPGGGYRRRVRVQVAAAGLAEALERGDIGARVDALQILWPGRRRGDRYQVGVETRAARALLDGD